MKRILGFLVIMAIATGCSSENREMDKAVAFRERLLSAEGCSFSAAVTADYGDSLQEFSMDCQGDQTGKLGFEITKPQSIAYIRGEITASGGNILFENQALYLPLLTDDLLTPASAPWIFLKTLRSGYITSAGSEGQLLHLSIDDSYEDDALNLDIWIDGDRPVRADILHEGKRFLSLEIENFQFL